MTLQEVIANCLPADRTPYRIEPRVRTRQSILKAHYKGGLDAESKRRYQLPFLALTTDQINEWYFSVYPAAPAIERIRRMNREGR
jgi:hypothetical protein